MQLTECWLNDAADPSDRIVLAYVGDAYDVEETLGGGIETGYASGRSRIYSTEDDTTSIKLPLDNLTASDIDWLSAHRGRPLWFRDPRGRKIACAYMSLPVTVSTMPVGFSGTIDKGSLSLTSVTVSEAV